MQTTYLARSAKGHPVAGRPVQCVGRIGMQRTVKLPGDKIWNSRVAAFQEHLSDTDVDELRSAAMDRIAELKKGN